MLPMHKETRKGFRHIHQPIISIGSWPLPKPTIPVSNPMSKTEVKTAKHIPHFSFPELTKVVNPSSGLQFQYFSNFIYSKMSPPMDFEFKENLIYSLLTFLTDTRGEANAQFPPSFDYTGLKCIPQKVKRFVHQLHWHLPLLIVIAVYYFRLILIEA
jgi:hypothetical protein